MAGRIEARLTELGIELPQAAAAVANRVLPVPPIPNRVTSRDDKW